MNNKSKALGRGLDALLKSNETTHNVSENVISAGSISNISIEQIMANPFQPRDMFDEEKLNELSESIKHQGVIVPITVRKQNEKKYQIISGERRFRASVMAGLTEIPCYVRVANDQSMLEMALVENLQRENLNAIETAIGFKRLVDECSLTQEELSSRVGKNRSTITNYLRLLRLPAEIQLGIKNNMITMGHARAIINIDDTKKQLEIFNEIVNKNLSVRQVEEISRASKESIEKHKPLRVSETTISAKHEEVKDKMIEVLKSDIKIKVNPKGRGNIIIPFVSDEDFERLTSLFIKE